MLKKSLGIVALLVALSMVFIGCGELPVIVSVAPTDAEIFVGNGATYEGKNSYLIGTSAYKELVVSFNYEFSGFEIEIDFSMSGGLEDYGINVTETHTMLHADWTAGKPPYGCVGAEMYGEKESPFKFTASTTIDSIKINTNSGAPGTAKITINSIKVDGNEIDIVHDGRSFKDDYVWVPGSKTPGGGDLPDPVMFVDIMDRGTGGLGGDDPSLEIATDTLTVKDANPVNVFAYALTTAEKTALAKAATSGIPLNLFFRVVANGAWWQGGKAYLGNGTDVVAVWELNSFEEMGYGVAGVTVTYAGVTDIEEKADITKATHFYWVYNSGQELNVPSNFLTRIILFGEDIVTNIFTTNNLGPNVVKHADSGQSVFAQKFDTGIEIKGRSAASSGLRVVVDKNGLDLDIMKGYRMTVEGRVLNGSAAVTLDAIAAARNGNYASVYQFAKGSATTGAFKVVGDFHYPQKGFKLNRPGDQDFEAYADYMADAVATHAIRIATDTGTSDLLITSIVIDWLEVDDTLPTVPTTWEIPKAALDASISHGGWDVNGDNDAGWEFGGGYGVLNINFGPFGALYNKAVIHIDVKDGVPGEVVIGQLNDHDTRLDSYKNPAGSAEADKWIKFEATGAATLDVVTDECEDPGVRIQCKTDGFKFTVTKVVFSEKK